jgi:MGT family glycosyltransferase
MFQGSGNIPPLLAVARELVERGHRVSIIAGPGLTPERPAPVTEAFSSGIAAAGATRIPFDPPENALVRPPPRRGLFLGYAPAAFAPNVVAARRFLAAAAWARAARGALARHPFDLLVADFYLLGALAAAEAQGVPSVALAHHHHIRPAPGVPPFGPAWRPSTTVFGAVRDAIGNRIVERIHRRDGLAALNRAREELGLRALRSPLEQYDAAARVLIMTSPAFDFQARAWPANLRHVGMPMSPPEPSRWRPPWPAEDRRPLVLASFSTAEQGQAEVLRRTLIALGTLPVRALVTLGPALSRKGFDAPPNVVVETFLPHEAVLPHASAIVSQCGHGTVMKALLCGVPLVCLPLVGDQPGIAARVEHAGAGLRLARGVSPRRIRRAIERVLADARYRQCARRLAMRLKTENGAATAADEIESAA